ncbi:MAG: energy transducer TonB [Spirochaetes bacterium]|nr:energy transducer TonB [Spirochaetota bacterium]
MILKIDRNFKNSLIIAFLAHVLLFILLIPFIDLKYLGVEKKKESDRIRARLVQLVRDSGGSQSRDLSLLQKSGSAPAIQWQSKSTKIQLDENLPRITIPTIQESDRSFPEQKKQFKEDEIKIKKTGEEAKTAGEEIDIKIKEDMSKDAKLSAKGKDLDGPGESLQGEIDKISKGPGTDNKMKPGTALPGGLSIDGIVDGKGEIIWDENNKMPEYPEEARKAGMEGDVRLRLTLNVKGEATQIFIDEKSGYPLLDRAARLEAKKWKIFIMEKGLARPGIIKLTITFRLK